MKAAIINGSPRRAWNTSQILTAVKEGAESSGIEVEYIDLYDLKYTGCRSCLACKRKGIEEPWKCYWKDELSPVLEKVYQADKLVMGAPIYFGEPSGELRSFMERLVFPALTYNDYTSVFEGRLDILAFLTMNVTKDYYVKSYSKRMEEWFAPFRLLNGTINIYPVCDTLQVKEYSKFDMAGFDEEHKKAVHETAFTEDLRKAYEVGKNMRV